MTEDDVTLKHLEAARATNPPENDNIDYLNLAEFHLMAGNFRQSRMYAYVYIRRGELDLILAEDNHYPPLMKISRSTILKHRSSNTGRTSASITINSHGLTISATWSHCS